MAQVDLGGLDRALLASARQAGGGAIAPALHDICQLLGTAPGPDDAADAARLVADIMAGGTGARMQAPTHRCTRSSRVRVRAAHQLRVREFRAASCRNSLACTHTSSSSAPPAMMWLCVRLQSRRRRRPRTLLRHCSQRPPTWRMPRLMVTCTAPLQ